MVTVTAGILRRDGRYLVAQRKLDDSMGGYWEFPGGGVEPDETPDQCIVRELREELGVEVRPLYLYDSLVTGEGHLVVLFYRCELLRGDPQPLDCEQIQWALPVDLPNYEFLPSDREIVERIAQEG